MKLWPRQNISESLFIIIVTLSMIVILQKHTTYPNKDLRRQITTENKIKFLNIFLGVGTPLIYIISNIKC